MQWSYLFHDSWNEMIEYEVLKELRPPPKLKKLKILYNKGTRFPSWVSDPLFDQLTELVLLSCRSTHLPTLGHLRSLNKLVVRSMSEVKTVGFELLAPPNSFPGIAFPSLEVLEFNGMEGWENLSISIGGDLGTPRSFPRLHEISINCCPKLAEVSIGLIPSLRILRIQNCSDAVFRSMVGLSSSLFQLQISNVKGLTHLHGEDLMHLGALEHLDIDRCDELGYLWELDSEACKSLVSLLSLEVWNCKMLVSSAEKEVSFGFSMKSLREVLLYKCDSLESYLCPNNVERLTIERCGSMKSLTFSTVQGHPSSVSESMSRLKSLAILDCKNLNSFPLEHLHSLAALGQMVIVACPSIDYSFPCGLWPPNLKHLRIGGLNKPMSEWGVQNFPTSLVKVRLYGENSGVVSFAVADTVRNTSTITTPSSSCFLLPPSLVSLELNGFKDVESFSEVLQHLPCLKRLHIYKCPKIRDIMTTSDPSNLTIIVRQ